MAIEVRHLGHTYTYRHPVGWSGGEQHVRDELNKHQPAGDYPDEEAEQTALKHALGGVLAGGQAVEPGSGRHVPGSDEATEPEATSPDAASEESSRIPDHNPEMILDEAREDDLPGDPDRILEDQG